MRTYEEYNQIMNIKETKENVSKCFIALEVGLMALYMIDNENANIYLGLRKKLNRIKKVYESEVK